MNVHQNARLTPKGREVLVGRLERCCATNWMRFRDNQDETLRRACAGGRA